MKIKDVMTKNYQLLNINADIGQIYDKLTNKRSHIILIKDGSLMRILSKIPSNMFSSKKFDIKKISNPIPTIKNDDLLLRAIEKMVDLNVGIIAVTKKDIVCGIVTQSHAESVIALYIRKLQDGHN